jgi:hypothetical protein
MAAPIEQEGESPWRCRNRKKAKAELQEKKRLIPLECQWIDP